MTTLTANTPPHTFRPLSALLFDLDGTLWDTDDVAVERLAARLACWRVGRPDRWARRLVMASETPLNALWTGLDVLGLDGPLVSLRERLRPHQTPHTAPRLMAGCGEMIAALRGRYRLGTVTTRSRRDAEEFLEQSGLRPAMDVVVTCESTRRLKPHPEPVLYAAQHLQVSPADCMMVGDTVVDVLSARRAGAYAVAVLCGFGERAELERAGAHALLDRTADLVSLLGE